jgi:hypothetical protein
MKQSRFTDEQIIDFLKQADAGMYVKEPIVTAPSKSLRSYCTEKSQNFSYSHSPLQAFFYRNRRHPSQQSSRL